MKHGFATFMSGTREHLQQWKHWLTLCTEGQGLVSRESWRCFFFGCWWNVTGGFSSKGSCNSWTINAMWPCCSSYGAMSLPSAVQSQLMGSYLTTTMPLHTSQLSTTRDNSSEFTDHPLSLLTTLCILQVWHHLTCTCSNSGRSILLKHIKCAMSLVVKCWPPWTTSWPLQRPTSAQDRTLQAGSRAVQPPGGQWVQLRGLVSK